MNKKFVLILNQNVWKAARKFKFPDFPHFTDEEIERVMRGNGIIKETEHTIYALDRKMPVKNS